MRNVKSDMMMGEWEGKLAGAYFGAISRRFSGGKTKIYIYLKTCVRTCFVGQTL
jgi:hypothetical protein